MKLIPLTQGQFVAVDDVDYDSLSQWKWHAWQNQTGSFYAVRGDRSDGPLRRIYMHRFLLGLQHGDKRLVDHANRNTLDNRQGNLRIATPSQNSANQKVRSTNTSGFKGVSRSSRGGRWISQITVQGKNRCLGRFDSPELAHEAYVRAAKEGFGAFAYNGQSEQPEG